MDLWISNMALNAHTLKRFIFTYELYYGETPIIHKQGSNEVYVDGIGEKLIIKTLSQIAIFYAWRLANKIKSTEPFSKCDYDQLSTWLNDRWISRKGVAAILGVGSAAFSKEYGISKCVHTAHQAVLKYPGGLQSEIFTHNGLSLDANGWGKELNIDQNTFRKRKTKYGVCDLLFMTKEEYIKVPIEVRRRYAANNTAKSVPSKGNEEWNKLSSTSESAFSDASKKTDLPYNIAVEIVAALIKDSKDNLVKGDKGKLNDRYFRASQRFLMDTSGQLSYYIEVIDGLDTEAVLKELYHYATEGYKEDQKKQKNIALLKKGVHGTHSQKRIQTV